MADATLQAIRTKIRRITHSPTAAQLSDSILDEYINTALLYDFPQHLRLFPLRSTLTFYTQPGVDTYETETIVTTDPLYNFKNRYIAVHPPIYIAGVQAYYTQDRNLFYGAWPQTNTILDTLQRGDGTTGTFTGSVTNPNPPYPFVLQNSVNFNCVDTSGESMVLVDYPVSNTTGALGLPEQPQTLPSPYGQIDYTTGAFTLNFPNVTQAGAVIYFEGILYQPGKPVGMLYFDSKFTLRPVPDKTYAVQIEVDKQPTELIQTTDVPEIEQWWQFVSYLASKKIFDDRLDTESIQQLMPELKNQERLVQRATIEQQATQRAPTIYSTGKTYGMWGNYFGGSGWPY
jgi:hypothetical protein